MSLRFKHAIAVLGVSAAGFSVLAPSSTLSMGPERTSKCYWLSVPNAPNGTTAPPAEEQIWCYKNLDKPQGATLIYNVDEDGETKPELSFMVEADGTLTHASLLNGKISIHRLRSNYNPLNIPITPPPNAKPAMEPLSSESLDQGATNVLSALSTANVESTMIRVLSEGIFTSSVAPESVPWRGFWFPFSSGRLHKGSDSPMAKFDRFVKARTGLNPGAQSWEARRHGFNGTTWEGHCNGWAAASVLRHEPKQPWTDPLSGVTFTVSDLKGLLIENGFCVKVAFFGSRYNGAPGENQSDINPVLFHNTISYYLGDLKKPVLMDLMSSPPVENSAISAFKMDVSSLGPHVYKVVTTLKVHNYDNQRSEDVGTAPSVDRVYSYKLWTDDQGNITRGAWLSSNPDFLWVPLSYSKCTTGNPALTDSWVRKIGKPIGLPEW